MNTFLRILGYPCWMLGSIVDIIFGLFLMPILLLSCRFKFRKLNHFIAKLRLEIAVITTLAPLNMITGDNITEENYLQTLESIMKPYTL